MKILLFLFLVFFAFASGAAVPPPVTVETVDGISGFFSSVLGFFSSIEYFIFEYIPQLISNFFVWVTSWYLKMKFLSIFYGLEFAHSVALTFLDLINISSFVNSAISSLPSDMKQLASDIRFFDALTLVVEAWITKLVYSGN